jgi:hypothetical protein
MVMKRGEDVHGWISVRKEKPPDLLGSGGFVRKVLIRLEGFSLHPMGDMMAGMMAGGEDHGGTFDLRVEHGETPPVNFCLMTRGISYDGAQEVGTSRVPPLAPASIPPPVLSQGDPHATSLDPARPQPDARLEHGCSGTQTYAHRRERGSLPLAGECDGGRRRWTG